MAQRVEPMDIDTSACDFDNKENTCHSNVLPRTPCTEKGYEELDVSELNMKLRYSLTPANSPMSKSYTANSLVQHLETGDNNENGNLTRSLHSAIHSDNLVKSQKVIPLQSLSADRLDNNRSALRFLDPTSTVGNDNITVTISGTNDDENLSFPSSTSSMVHTPEATTPTKEIPKSDGSPILRGLKSVLNMFRPSQSPIPPEDENDNFKEILSPPIVASPDTPAESRHSALLASTPLNSHKTISKRNSPNRDSLVFNEDLEKELEWKDETTIIFSKEKIPIHKLFFQQSMPEANQTSKVNNEKKMQDTEENFDGTVEFMDISYNDSIRDKTYSEIQVEIINRSDVIGTESDSEFVDCETTFSKNNSQVSFKSQEGDLDEVVDNKQLLNLTNETLDATVSVKSADISIASTETTRASINTFLTENVSPSNLSEVTEDVVNDGVNEDHCPAIADLNLVCESHLITTVDNTLQLPQTEPGKPNHDVTLPIETPLVSNDFNILIDQGPKNIEMNSTVNDIINTQPVIVNKTVKDITNISPALHVISQIPLITDPRVLLFNISQDSVKEEEVLQHTVNTVGTLPVEIPLPDADIKNFVSLPTENSENNISPALHVVSQIPSIADPRALLFNLSQDPVKEIEVAQHTVDTVGTLPVDIALTDVDADIKNMVSQPTENSENNISPALHVVSQIPFIADPRLLLFNLSQDPDKEIEVPQHTVDTLGSLPVDTLGSLPVDIPLPDIDADIKNMVSQPCYGVSVENSENNISPALHFVSQIPLISDPRVLLFNISQDPVNEIEVPQHTEDNLGTLPVTILIPDSNINVDIKNMVSQPTEKSENKVQGTLADAKDDQINLETAVVDLIPVKAAPVETNMLDNDLPEVKNLLANIAMNKNILKPESHLALISNEFIAHAQIIEPDVIKVVQENEEDLVKPQNNEPFVNENMKVNIDILTSVDQTKTGSVVGDDNAANDIAFIPEVEDIPIELKEEITKVVHEELSVLETKKPEEHPEKKYETLLTVNPINKSAKDNFTAHDNSTFTQSLVMDTVTEDLDKAEEVIANETIEILPQVKAGDVLSVHSSSEKVTLSDNINAIQAAMVTPTAITEEFKMDITFEEVKNESGLDICQEIAWDIVNKTIEMATGHIVEHCKMDSPLKENEETYVIAVSHNVIPELNTVNQNIVIVANEVNGMKLTAVETRLFSENITNQTELVEPTNDIATLESILTERKSSDVAETPEEIKVILKASDANVPIVSQIEAVAKEDQPLDVIVNHITNKTGVITPTNDIATIESISIERKSSEVTETSTPKESNVVKSPDSDVNIPTVSLIEEVAKENQPLGIIINQVIENNEEKINAIDEEIVASENNCPFVSVTVDSKKISEIKHLENFEQIENPFKTNTTISMSPPISPKIFSKGYNFNFDEIDDPFATKTNIRQSPPPSATPNTLFDQLDTGFGRIEVPKRDTNKNRRKSQPVRKKPARANKKLNSTVVGTISGDMKTPVKIESNQEPVFEKIEDKASVLNADPNVTKDVDNNVIPLIPVLSVEEIEQDIFVTELPEIGNNSFEKDVSSKIIFMADLPEIDNNTLVGKMVTKNNPNTLNITSNIKYDKTSKIDAVVEPETLILNPGSQYSFETETKNTSSSEQSTYFSAGTPSIHFDPSNSLGSKNVFNLPEIDDIHFNPFVSKSKMRQSPLPGEQIDKTVATQVGEAHVPDSTIIIEQNHDATVNVTSLKESPAIVDRMTEQKQEIDQEEKDSSNNSNATWSSKGTDDKDNTVREIHTEDEDTIEGPFLEAEDLNNDDKISDFEGENVDMMQFTDIPPQELDDNADAGELFIDAEAFEFLLNQNQSNVVSDSGKESLFLKFDPLFAKRMSSDGVLAALSKVQKRQSTPKKVAESNRDATFVKKSPITGPSNMNITCDININNQDESNDDLNVTVSKPMMVVNPAVNPVAAPRNKSLTPTRTTNRRSLTFTSPAIAFIDRLLSMSANNSLVGHETTVTEVNSEQYEADLALTQLRELLADKEINVYNLRTESKQLKERLANLESQMKSLEATSEERLKKINELTDRLNEKTKINRSMATVVEEYERTIASLMSETEQDRKRHAQERIELMKERDEQTAHLASMEVSFSDLHSKYEKSKQVILGFKTNEEIYKKSIKEFDDNLSKMQNNYELLKQHATSKLNHANDELQKMNRAHEAEVLKLNAMMKRKELHITSLEETLLQKTKANEELTAICDELINKVG